MTSYKLIGNIALGYVPKLGKTEKYFMATGKNAAVGVRIEFVITEGIWRMWIAYPGITCCIALIDVVVGHHYESGDFDFNVGAHEFNLPVLELK